MFVARRFAAPVLGGAMIGAGIATMHYIGMAALRAPAQLHWDAGYVLVPVAIVMTFAAAGIRVTSRGPVLRGRLLAVCATRPGDCRTSFHGHGGSHSCARSAYRGAWPCRLPNYPRVALSTVMAVIAGLGLLGPDDYLALGRARGGAAPAQRGPFGARSADRPYRQHRTGFANWRHRMVRRNLPDLRSRSESARAHGGSVPRSLSSRRSRRV